MVILMANNNICVRQWGLRLGVSRSVYLCTMWLYLHFQTTYGIYYNHLQKTLILSDNNYPACTLQGTGCCNKSSDIKYLKQRHEAGECIFFKIWSKVKESYTIYIVYFYCTCIVIICTGMYLMYKADPNCSMHKKKRYK